MEGYLLVPGLCEAKEFSLEAVLLYGVRFKVFEVTLEASVSVWVAVCNVNTIIVIFLSS